MVVGAAASTKCRLISVVFLFLYEPSRCTSALFNFIHGRITLHLQFGEIFRMDHICMVPETKMCLVVKSRLRTVMWYAYCKLMGFSSIEILVF